MKTYYFIFILFFFSLSCKKKKETPSSPPVIEIESVTPLSVKQFKDSVIIKLKYSDKNGDLGDESADELSLQIKDSRLPNPDWQHVKPLAPIGSNVSIEGVLRIKISTMFLLGNGDSEVSNLTIKIKDQQGNWSNEVVSNPITIIK